MNQAQYSKLFSFLWNIANDVLVHAFEKGKYKDIIMPMLVLRRIDVLLEPTKDKVLERKAQLDKFGVTNQDQALCMVTGFPFYNHSKFTLKTLINETDPKRLRMNFIDYINGYSEDVLEIIDKFHLRQQIDNLTETGRLGSLIAKFTDSNINLSIKPVVDDEGNEVLPALDNHTMGTIFEELLRKFNEENNVTEAGEHFTPRDYVMLLADLAVVPVADKLENRPYALLGGYWAEERNSIDGKVSHGIVWFDANGRQTARKELFSFPDKEAASYFTAPIVKQISDNCYFYYDAFSCAGYEITGHNVNKVVTINYGDFGAEREKLNDMAYREQNRDTFCEVLDFNYDDNKIILLTVKGKTFKASIVDMASGYSLFCHNINNPRRGGGVEIWNGSKQCIWPSYFKNGTMYGLTETSEIDHEILKNKGVAIDQDAEANPSLVIISPQ